MGPDATVRNKMPKPPPHIEAPLHVRGESEYVDDVAPPLGMLHAAVFYAPVAHGRIRRIDTGPALAHPEVAAVLTSSDIPGTNELGAIFLDEQSLADEMVHYIGQPIALVLATTVEAARAATHLIDCDIEPLPVVVDPRRAHDAGDFHGTPRTFRIGDVEAAWADCDVIVEGSCDIAGQEHLYLETNRARALPQEGGRITIASSTQSPYSVQRHVARVLGIPEHLVEVDVRRIGGGFGGKEDQATYWAVLAALGAYVTGRPVQLLLDRVDDLVMTGKRHPYEADFKLGLGADGRFIAYDVTLYQNSGATADLSPAVLERSLFHATNAYFFPHARIYAACCRTNLHPHTAFRGFGGPQSMFVVEAAITAAAERLGVAPWELQKKNLLRRGQPLPYGQTAEEDKAVETWVEAEETFDLAAWRARVDAFNANHRTEKKGLAVMPVVFGISFTKTHLNQASALVHVYTDGSVSVSNGGIEMGQGLTTNLATIVGAELGLDLDRVRIESTNTTRVANMSPSAASATTDLNGHAAIDACRKIRGRILQCVADETGRASEDLSFRASQLYDGAHAVEEWDWPRAVTACYLRRVDLSAHGFYATPGLHFDVAKERGRPFAYHVYGTSVTEVTVDCLRGVYEVDTVKIVHNLGRSLNEVVDRGQIEGGLMQGIGWMTLEELAYGDDGRLLSRALSTYKAPDVYFAPDLEVKWLESERPAGPRGSKAVGEPPFMYGIGTYFAIRAAMRAFAPRPYAFDAPATPERVLLALHGHHVDQPSSQPQPQPAPAVRPASAPAE
ncbi:MAG: molybdopterin cofactor-binding domain-containing protein [Myxococcota bacterium]